jgi:hypothetical protein
MTQRERERGYRSMLGGFIATVTYGDFSLYAILTEDAGLDVHTRRALLLSIALGTIVVLLAGSFLILRLALRNCARGNPAGEEPTASHGR